MEKRDDATDVAPATSKRRATEYQSSVSRTSGQATRTRLSSIFPAATTVLKATDFAFEGAEGLNRSFGVASRPYESLAQMALRGKVTQLCAQHANDAGTTLFKLETGKQLLDGEVAPTDATQRLAVAVARNAWLHPYAATDVEVQELISVYNTVKNDTSGEGGETGAKKALCMTALLAPQFWMGPPESTDAAKRVSLEFFRRVPPMQELKDFADKKFTIEQYFDRLLADSTASAGFKSTVHQWHEEWLGFREFIDQTMPYADRRQSALEGAVGASSLMALTYVADGSSAGGNEVILPGRLAGHRAGGCLSTGAQAFDSDTNMIAWEHKNYERGRFEFVGGYIRTGTSFPDTDSDPLRMSVADVDDALGKMAANGGGLQNLLVTDTTTRRMIIKDICRMNADTHRRDNQEDVLEAGAGTARGVTWTRCHGLLSLGTTSATHIENALRSMFAQADVWQGYSQITDGTVWPMSSWCKNKTGADLTSCITAYQNLSIAYRNTYFLNDIRQLINRLKTYNATGQVKHASQTALDLLTTQDALYAARASFTNGAGHIDTLTDAIAAGSGNSSWFYETRLDEMKNPTPVVTVNLRYNYGGFERFTQYLQHFIGGPGTESFLPIQQTGTYGWEPSSRRVRRFAPSSGGHWQDGFSTAKLWYTGGNVSTCNTFDRHWATCFYRPKNYAVDGKDLSSFNGAEAAMWARFYAWTPENAHHPRVLTGLYCGLPSSSAIASHANGASNDAYQAVKHTNLNNVAVNIDFQSYTAGPMGSAIGNETRVHGELYSQLREEPYKLIEKLILTKDDYRKILTADYTIGNKCLEFFYETQGYYLPMHAKAVGVACSGPNSTEAEFKTTASIPIGHITGLGGVTQTSSPARNAMWLKLNGGPPAQIPPRVHSGILTMPAFVAPVATKARGIAARYFARLLCDQPTFYDPAKDAVQAAQKLDLHKSFISHRKHLQDACFQCHRNLDPLSAALSWTFQGLLLGKDCVTAHGTTACLLDDTKNVKTGETVNTVGGEGSLYDFLGEWDTVKLKDDRPFVGLRHAGGPGGRGAYMGQSVTGIRELAQKVSESDRFARCVGETTFEFVFGRKVQFSDLTFFNEMVTDWKAGDTAKGYQPYRYLDLIKLMITSENYQRKN